MVQNGLRGVDIAEEEVEAAFHEPWREQSWGPRKGGGEGAAVDA